MINIKKLMITKVLVIFLSMFLFVGSTGLDGQKINTPAHFELAKKDFIAGKYLQIMGRLKILLKVTPKGDSIMRGKIHLLLAAAYEKESKLKLAKKNYQKSVGLTYHAQIEGLDLSGLVGYRKWVLGESIKVAVSDSGLIEKPAEKKSKKFPWLLVAGGAAAIVIAAILLKKKAEEVDFNPNYDTEVLGVNWVEIPAGEFNMGSFGGKMTTTADTAGHTVHLDKYYIAKYETTFNQYLKFCDATGRSKPRDKGWGGNKPVMNVSWHDANDFCSWLSRVTGKKISLPTEAQWEKAARGTDYRTYPWGDALPSRNFVNFGSLHGSTMDVNTFPEGQSPYGLFHMAGNVSEWCYDYYHDNYYQISPASNPTGPESGSWRVVRGGSWYQDKSAAIDSSSILLYRRTAQGPVDKFSDLGFRIVMED